MLVAAPMDPATNELAMVKTLTEFEMEFATHTREPRKVAWTGPIATLVTPVLESPETSICMPVPG